LQRLYFNYQKHFLSRFFIFNYKLQLNTGFKCGCKCEIFLLINVFKLEIKVVKKKKLIYKLKTCEFELYDFKIEIHFIMKFLLQLQVSPFMCARAGTFTHIVYIT
jgi:hypothetical protein